MFSESSAFFLTSLSFFAPVETPSCWKRSLSRWPRLSVGCLAFPPLVIKHSQALVTLVRLRIAGFFFFTCEPNYSCRMLRNVDDKRRLPFFFPSSQQSENGELWRPCENFPGKNQRAKNLYRMPRVSMRTSGKSEYLSDLAGWFLFDHAGVLKALYVGDAHVTRTRNVYRVVILGLVREDTPNSASNPVTSSESTWQEGDDLLCNASQTAIVQHLEPFNN